MAQYHLLRPDSCRGKDLVFEVDCLLFRAVRGPLSKVLAQSIGGEIRTGFYPHPMRLELCATLPLQPLIGSRPVRERKRDILADLYSELQTVCEALEYCEIVPDTGRITLPGQDLPMLEEVQYDSVLALFDVLARESQSSMAPLTCEVDGNQRVLRLRPKSRVRAIKDQAHLSAYGPKGSEPTSVRGNNPDGKLSGPDDKEDKEDKEDNDGQQSSGNNAEREPRSFLLVERLSDKVFSDGEGKTIALTNQSLGNARPGDTVCLRDYTIVDGSDLLAISAGQVEIFRQGELDFG